MCLFMCRRREKIMEGITMLDPKKVRLGICPIGWSNDDMWDLGDENTFQQCISEMKLAGFDGCEVGHKYPEDKTVLKHMLDVRNMTIASKWFSSFLVDKPYEEVEAEFVKELEYRPTLALPLSTFPSSPALSRASSTPRFWTTRSAF